MKILPEISNLTAKFINVSEGNFTLLTINENINILFKNGNQLNKDILLDLIESKGYATSLLYLNETSQVYLNEQTDLINESNINDYYSDCEELLTKNIIIVEEAGIPLVNINGYKIYESDIGVLRGNGKKKIKESFDNKELDNDLKEAIKQHIIDAYSEEGKHYGFDSRAPYLTDGYAVAIYQRVKGGLPSYNIISNMKKYYEDIKDTVVKENNLKESINTEDLAYDLLDLAKIIDLYDFKDNYNSDEEALEEFKRDLNSKSQIKDYITFIRNYIEDNPDDSDTIEKAESIIARLELLDNSLNEDGTQASDIAPKVDQNIGINKPNKKYYDILLSDINENENPIINKGFFKNSKGQYERNGFILVKEGEKYLAIRKDKLQESKT